MGLRFGRAALGPCAARLAVGRQTDDGAGRVRGEGGGREGAVAFPHPTYVGGGLASAGSPDVSSSSSSRSWRQRFNWQDFGLRTDVASLGLEAGRAGAEEGAGRSGQSRLRETPARRP